MAERTAEASGPVGHGSCWGFFTGRHHRTAEGQSSVLARLAVAWLTGG